MIMADIIDMLSFMVFDALLIFDIEKRIMAIMFA
jgi:hypothetical protein